MSDMKVVPLNGSAGWQLQKVAAVPQFFNGREALKLELLPAVAAGQPGKEKVMRKRRWMPLKLHKVSSKIPEPIPSIFTWFLKT